MTSTIFINVQQTEFLGLIGVAISRKGLLRLRMFQNGIDAFLALNEVYREGIYQYSKVETEAVLAQINAYLDHEIQTFTLPIDWSGYTDFQKAVLMETQGIPYGETRSYGQVAAAIGRPKASRAVGQAEKRNDVPLVIPCHRVIGSDGSLTGYGGKENTDLKAQLLKFEQAGVNRISS
ncbi:MAG: methylated-DNA--[protein]-cysteine S-methyltransferase [Anaerolineales bacterium]|nr:methylated-DNA--[protein]-cysteine S-methyltransferase [Anaerolineales bacterium]